MAKLKGLKTKAENENGVHPFACGEAGERWTPLSKTGHWGPGAEPPLVQLMVNKAETMPVVPMLFGVKFFLMNQ
ncbi:MAG: hypothetical protein V4718_10015 [Pseudomonadota bacterium]